MKIARLVKLITPMTIMACLGVVTVGYGILHLSEKNSILNFFFGIPLTIGSLLAHFLIRRVLDARTLPIWLVEFLLVATFWLAFYFVW
ncbi:hypothetical protein ACFPMF_20980 [Larkinella bovis]|uniref:Uncharacterized protein n=1 Tax=Larkinella bovis TaxID=683041 RepID=A0ABW0IHF7_9BACT